MSSYVHYSMTSNVLNLQNNLSESYNVAPIEIFVIFQIVHLTVIKVLLDIVFTP